MNTPNEQTLAERSADKIDLRILRVLQKDGRISNLKLAEEVHLSPTAVLEREIGRASCRERV